MKTRCFLFLMMLSVSLVLCACDAKRRAQRRIRRITERCPELLTVQAHPIDTFLAVPSVADSARLPLAPLMEGQPVVVTTEQGTFTATATDDTLTITYETEPEPIHFSDTVKYAQVVIEEQPPAKKKPPAFLWFLLGMVVVLLAIIITAIIIVIKMVKTS